MPKIRYEEKIAAIKEYQAGKGSYAKIAKKYGIGTTTLRDMVGQYESQGLRKSGRKKYSEETKSEAVKEYLEL